MKYKTSYQFSVLLLHYVVLTICENYYTVIAPGLLKSNRKYTVTITWHNSNTPCLVRISILGVSYNATNEILVGPYETKNTEFFPSKLQKGDYKLLAEGIKGCVFRNESELLVDSEAGPKIYIQTDKAIYKPMDLVQFRVVILDEHTRPISIKEPIRIDVFDNNENRIKQFKDITLTKGVFTGKFKLSQKPVMGEWEIRVTISGKYSYKRSKEIQVQMYKLPKFSLYVDLPQHFILQEPQFKVEIYGKYTFDKYVEGTLHVELLTLFTDILIDQQTLHIEGLTVVEFNIKDVEKLKDVGHLVFRASLEEKHSGITANISHNMNVWEKRYNMYLLEEEIEFRNNKPYRFKIHVEHWNNGPLSDLTTPVILEDGNKKYSAYLNNESVAIFDFDYKPYGEYRLKYKDTERNFPFLSFNIFKETFDREFCKLVVKESPRLGKPIKIEVQSSSNIPYLVYIVMGHGSIINVGHKKLPANTKNYTLELTPSIEMIPNSYLYVHYIHDGNLNYDEIALKFPKELENQISISTPKQVKPGQEVTLKLKAEPNSYVSILAVDLSVYLLDNSYDLYKDIILYDLMEDQSYIPNASIERPGIISGLITLTNAHYPVNIKDIYPVHNAGEEGMLFRTKFPETWIFNNYIINDTDTEIVLNIPETITTWRITAFSNNNVLGFGIVDGPTDITTFLPFFLTLNLPHAVKRGEIVTISVTVFNYYNQSLETDITMVNKDLKFHFVEPSSQQLDSNQQTKNVNIPPQGGKAIKFFIKCKDIGELEIRILANNTLYSDGVIQILNVIPEGITKYENEAIYLNAASAGNSSLILNIPEDIVPDSEHITLSVGGDFMIPFLDNLNDMVRMPTGCGEQNMVNFAPNILVLDYLKATGKYSNAVKLVDQAKYFIDIGYQQELSYRHSNGGYSVFGEEYDEVASTWLTAYVVRFFVKASKYTAIETRIIESALEFIASQQLTDGSFRYTGYLFFKELQDSHGFTAFALLAFLEDRKYSRTYQTKIRKAFRYLMHDLHNINDIYALSIIANALSRAKHPGVSKVIEKLQSLSMENEKGLKWWSSNGTDVETTAYTLMALLNTSDDNHLPILKWLIQQRNDKGGFKSTHDTVVGFEALVKYSQKYNNRTSWDMKLTYSAKDLVGNEMKINEFIINQENSGTLQQHELPKSVREINFEIQGNGYTMIQLSGQYNIKNDKNDKYFSMNINPSLNNDEEMDLEICFTYNAPQPALSNTSNMVIMEANLPTGFITGIDFNQNLEENEFVQRLETKNDDKTMLLYFDKLLSGIGHCVNIETYKTNEVEERKPASVVMYDYYDASQFNTEFYNV